MTREVRHSNNKINRVLSTLKYAENSMQLDFDDRVLDGNEVKDIRDVDTAKLLNNTTVTMKNLNYSLMKLVAVQQPSIQISKGTLCSFISID